MRFASLTLIPVFASALALAGCAGSPDPVFYALSAQKGRTVTSPPLRIEMRHAGLPGYLDRPHIVRRSSAERLELAADERWGAPLDAMVGATLSDDLAERLPNAVVFTESGSISAAADIRVEVEITRFELSADGTVQLQGGSAVRWTTATDAVRLKRHSFTARPASKSTPDLVAAMSLALGELADAIAQTIAEGAPPAKPLPPAEAEPAVVVPIKP